MKASKEWSSRLCQSGDVPPSAVRWGVSGVAFGVSDPAQVSGGSRCGALPGMLASARSARLARGALLGRSAAEGRRRPSSHSVSGVGPSGSAPGRSAANAWSLQCAASCGVSPLCIGGRSVPPPGSPICVRVGVCCGGPCLSSAPIVDSSHCGSVGGAGGSASSFVGCGAPRVWPSATGAGSGRLPGPAGCGAPAGAVVRAGSGPGLVPGVWQPGGDGSAGRAGGPAGGAWRRWGAGLSHVMAGKSPVPDVAGPWGVWPSVGPGVWGCTVPEGRAAVVSVGVAVCACVGGPSGGLCTGSAAGRSGVPWCGRGSVQACVAAARLAAGRGPCAGVTGGARGVGLPVGLWASSLCGCAVLGGCSGWAPTAPVFVGLGVVPLPAGDAQCPMSPVVLWCCVGCRCAAGLDARSYRGLCSVPALDGAGSPVARVASLACCWCGAATGVGGAEVDGLGDVDDVAAGIRAPTFVALVAVVARDGGGRVVIVAVVLRGE